MPRYYFDIQDHRGTNRDSHGIECDDAKDAGNKAQMLLADIVRKQGPNDDTYEITALVRDHSGLAIYTAQLRIQGTMHVANHTFQ